MKRFTLLVKLFTGNLLLMGIGVAIALSVWHHQSDASGNVLLWMMSAAVATAAILAILINWIWCSPLNQITETVEKLSDGNLEALAKVSGTDELARLARMLNRMRGNMAQQIQSVDTSRRQLRSMFDNLREGVIALDKTGHIVLINRSAGDLMTLDQTDRTGEEFKSVITDQGVLDIYHKLMSAGQHASGQTETRGQNGRILDVHAARVAAGEPEDIAILLVLRDVTEIAATAAMKAEFVANASHELRTPLATIRAAAETLNDETDANPQAVAKVAEILQRQITRLEQMTNDLLNLNLVEMPGAGPNLTDVSLASLVERVRKNHADQAQAKQIELDVAGNTEDFVFASDTKLLQLIIDNLVGNALKFTPQGGTVNCTLTGGENDVTIEIADTGCGISPEMHDRVFERFFQAQASRSGDASVRGTGLGLAIVKHATDRLGGQVSLASKLAEGTTVTVTLPLRPPTV